MVNWKSKKLSDMLMLANGLVLLVLINIVSSILFFRADLTEEKRYSIKEPTKALLRDLDDDVYIEVYLEGDINAGFRRFQTAIRETLEEFRVYSGNKIRYAFIDPAIATGQKARNEFMAELASKGIQPTRVFDNRDGQRTEKLVFPGALISYGGAETGVNLLTSNLGTSSEEKLNRSIEGIEFELAHAIYKLTVETPKRIGLVRGHGELDGAQAMAFRSALQEVYDVVDVSLSAGNLDDFDALVVAKPTTTFSEIEKYRLDQYIMRRGNVLLLLDKLEASMDSASREDYFAFPYNLNLDDQLFKYGVRINMDLVQDRSSGLTPVVTGQSGSKPEIQLMEWPFFPLINRYADHSITHNLDAVVMRFASSIDTVKADGIRKTPLLFTSQYSRTLTAPVNVSIPALRRDIKPENYSKQFIPVGYLLEGQFTSLFRNRFLPEGADKASFTAAGGPAKIIVVADGDLAANAVHPRTRQPQPLGFDVFTNYTYANQDLLMNMLAYLTDENGLIKARNKEIKIRPLDRQKVASEKLKWQLINLALPLVVLVAFGTARAFVRKKRYASF
ncbi:gliding motility-associated ABC transporter substrate-binding protein GldG [Fulvivirgaceae bacterium PWU4]|uniref:Gliding motility-associated ABC transporter substrate-binding protein GldG n=1 Tax=Chryseosolibacter histidini TaxID=2782349 RepID=A0AAP2DR92_9BACT|nr:gliding motility-associated ABC transporter substrate-binding protein GldG [Chryseosolibacter histidini]MBT1699782.1 gliding motility-associated ABC transporter substrate-binding protein GldG [Chryseosolibacter histidini]